MARKVFISVLGIHNYTPVYYKGWDDNQRVTDHRTKFIQEALVTKLCQNYGSEERPGFGPDDCIMVFRTKDSNNINWKDPKAEDGSPKKDEDGNAILGLETILKSMPNLICKINPEKDPSVDSYIIKEGFDEEQMWDIFNCIFEKLEPEDEIYFDVTHAFRTIPLFATALFNYARFLKYTKVAGIYYGAFEALSSLYKGEELKKMDPELLEAPIVDLTNLVRLQEINSAAAGFRDFGSLSSFSNLIHKSGIPEIDKAVSHIAKALTDLDGYIQTSQIDMIYEGEYMRTINERIIDFRNSPNTNEAQCKLLEEIQRTLTGSGFTPEKSDRNIEAAIKWARKHQMIQQAFTMAQEYLITRVYYLLENQNLREDLLNEILERKSVTEDKEEFEIRHEINTIIKNAHKYRYVKGCRKSKVNSEIGKILIGIYPVIKKLGRPYEELSNLRNELNHAGTTTYWYKDYGYYEREFDKCWDNCHSILDEM